MLCLGFPLGNKEKWWNNLGRKLTRWGYPVYDPAPASCSSRRTMNCLFDWKWISYVQAYRVTSKWSCFPDSRGLETGCGRDLFWWLQWTTPLDSHTLCSPSHIDSSLGPCCLNLVNGTLANMTWTVLTDWSSGLAIQPLCKEAQASLMERPRGERNKSLGFQLPCQGTRHVSKAILGIPVPAPFDCSCMRNLKLC